MEQNLFHIHAVISCALQKGWHKGISAPHPFVIVGQGIAYNSVIDATNPFVNDKIKEIMKTLTWEECLDQVAKRYNKYSGIPYNDWQDMEESLSTITSASQQSINNLLVRFKEAAELYRNQPSSLNEEETRWEFDKINGVGNTYVENVWDFILSKLSAKQREVDELKQWQEEAEEQLDLQQTYNRNLTEQLDEKIREAVRMARSGMMTESSLVENKHCSPYYTEEEILDKVRFSVSNDIRNSVPNATWQANITSLISTFQAAGKKHVYTAIWPQKPLK